MENNRFWRQLDLCPPDKLTFPITVIGAGAIGSATVVTLAKMGWSNITVYDEDDLADHNFPNQMSRCDLRRPCRASRDGGRSLVRKCRARVGPRRLKSALCSLTA